MSINCGRIDSKRSIRISDTASLFTLWSPSLMYFIGIHSNNKELLEYWLWFIPILEWHKNAFARIFIFKLGLDFCDTLAHCMLEILATFSNIKLGTRVSKSLVNHTKRRDVFMVFLLLQVDVLQFIDWCRDFSCVNSYIPQGLYIICSRVTELGWNQADFYLLNLIWIVDATHHGHLWTTWTESKCFLSLVFTFSLLSWTAKLDPHLTPL